MLKREPEIDRLYERFFQLVDMLPSADDFDTSDVDAVVDAALLIRAIDEVQQEILAIERAQ
jgi:hypothetical protein